MMLGTPIPPGAGGAIPLSRDRFQALPLQLHFASFVPLDSDEC